ncbi:PEP-CTERM sorting domain-containing protein [Cyanobacteria bacterium FACHB-DQ100]|nr:PEP-CTERM sorting domain-containing protein [Cyanobacteria bacterium FACHB-DQ100]
MPHNLPNFIFLGDNTTSANGSVRITRVDLSRSAIPFSPIAARARITSTPTAAPEPVTILGSGAAITIAGILQRKRR